MLESNSPEECSIFNHDISADRSGTLDLKTVKVITEQIMTCSLCKEFLSPWFPASTENVAMTTSGRWRSECGSCSLKNAAGDPKMMSADVRHLTNVFSMLDRRLRRRPSIKTTSSRHLVSFDFIQWPVTSFAGGWAFTHLFISYSGHFAKCKVPPPNSNVMIIEIHVIALLKNPIDRNVAAQFLLNDKNII